MEQFTKVFSSVRPQTLPGLIEDIDRLFAKANGSFYIKHRDGRLLWCNEYVANLTSFHSRYDLINKTDYEYSSEDLAFRTIQVDQRVMKLGVVETLIESGKKLNGDMVRAFSIKQPILTPDNECLGIFGQSTILNPPTTEQLFYSYCQKMQLTSQEASDVFKLVKFAMTYQEIAEARAKSVTKSTIQGSMESIMSKMNCMNRKGLINHFNEKFFRGYH